MFFLCSGLVCWGFREVLSSVMVLSAIQFSGDACGLRWTIQGLPYSDQFPGQAPLKSSGSRRPQPSKDEDLEVGGQVPQLDEWPLKRLLYSSR